MAEPLIIKVGAEIRVDGHDLIVVEIRSKAHAGGRIAIIEAIDPTTAIKCQDEQKNIAEMRGSTLDALKKFIDVLPKELGGGL